jgi:hypothetical protein
MSSDCIYRVGLRFEAKLLNFFNIHIPIEIEASPLIIKVFLIPLFRK